MENVLSSLGLKPTAVRVLSYLIEHDVSPAKEISAGLNLPKSTVYDALDELVNESLITEYNDERGRVFGVVDQERLARVSNSKIEELKKAHQALLEHINGSKKIKNVSRPKIKFYIGNEGIKQAFRDTMWHSGCKETYLMWPTKEMLEILGPEFSEWHSSQRLRFNIVLNVLRKNSDRDIEENTDKLAEGWKTFRKIRHVPKEIDWQMSYWIYDNQCLFASGGSEKFAFIVHSKEFTDLMIILWKQMWEISEE